MSRVFGISDLRDLIQKAEPNINSDTLDSLVRHLYPVFEPVDFEGKSLFIEVNGPHGDEQLDRFYAYADFLKKMGAKNVVFLPIGSRVSLHELSPDKTVKVVFEGDLPPEEVLEKYRDWLRIAGCDPNKIMFVAGCDVEIGD